jgi:hypothetical protein
MRLMQFIAVELGCEEARSLNLPPVVEVWSPYDAFEVAGTLTRLLAEETAIE